MTALRGLQRELADLYRLELDCDIHDFVRPLHPDDPDAHRGEVVLVAHEPDGASVAVCLDHRVEPVLAGDARPGMSRFEAWCAAVEGVSHFAMIAWRAARERPVSQLDLELQADVDKYAIAMLQRAAGRAPGDAHRSSRMMRAALFDRASFRDPPDTPRGQRYRAAHRMASRYTASLERRHLRHGRVRRMMEELRDFYRSSPATRFAMASR